MTEKKIKKQGFHEQIDPLLGKCRKHSIVAQKNKFDKEQVCDTSAIVPVPDEKDIVTLRYENTEEFTELAEQFEEDNDVQPVIRKDEDEIFVDIPVEMSGDFKEFLAEKGIQVKAITIDDAQITEVEDTITTKATEKADDAITIDDAKTTEEVGDKDDKDDESLVQSSEELKEPEANVEPEESEKKQVDDIIAEVQSERSKRAVSKDKSRTAKRVGRKENAGELIAWMKIPGKSDLSGVDTSAN